MAKADIGPKIGIDGEAEFKKQIKDINSSLTTLGTEMKAVTSEFQNNADSAKALGEQNKVLKKQIGELNEKLKVQNQALEAARKAYGDDSAEVQKWQNEINKTQAALNNANAQIEKNNGLLSEKRVEVIKGIAKGFEVLATAAVAAAVAIGKMTIASGEWADDLNTLSKQTGISTEELQKYQYAADRIDVSLDTLTGSMSKLTKNMSSAQKGSGAAAEAFDKLGVSVTDAKGELRDNEDVFADTIEALSKIENETERDATAMAIFGKSAQELNPLILGGADALKQLGEEAEAAGLILDQDSIDKLNGVADAMDKLKATFTGAGHLFSVEFAEPLAAAVDLITGYIQQITSSFDDFDKLGETIGSVLSDLTGKIVSYLPEVINLGMDILLALAEGIIENLPQMTETAIQIIVTLANSLSENLPELIPVAVEAVLTIVQALIDNIDLLVEASIQLITALAEGLIASLPILIDKAPKLVEGLSGAIIESSPEMGAASTEIVVQLTQGIINNAWQLNKACWKIVETILQSLINLYKQDYISIGKNIVEGIWSGITEKTQWLIGKITGWFNNVVAAVKSFLGIESPSKLFANEVGAMMAEGVAVGWNSELGNVRRDINGSMATLLPDATANIGVRASMQPVTNASLADSVNAIGTLMGGNSGNLNIVIQTDGREFYRATLEDFRLIQSENPVVVPA